MSFYTISPQGLHSLRVCLNLWECGREWDSKISIWEIDTFSRKRKRNAKKKKRRDDEKERERATTPHANKNNNPGTALHFFFFLPYHVLNRRKTMLVSLNFNMDSGDTHQLHSWGSSHAYTIYTHKLHSVEAHSVPFGVNNSTPLGHFSCASKECRYCTVRSFHSLHTI